MTEEVSSDEAAAVFRRAAEIDQGPGSSGRGLDLAALEQAGMEAGLSRRSIRQALAEVRASAPAPDRPDAIVARTLDLSPESVEHDVEKFMRHQLFQVARRFEDRTLWEPRRGLGASLAKSFDFNRRIVLRELSRVTTCVVEVPGENRTHVRFELSLGGVRWGWYALPISTGVLAAAGVGVAVALGTAPEVLIAAPGAVAVTGGAFAGARAGIRGSLRRGTNGVERFLDLLERGR
ncbi:MAG TPA: hypothetical protein VFB78_05590 [Acidimicrobiales bacterium]|nr:hypothetical protein [Acidimicrobiales bacterium]